MHNTVDKNLRESLLAMSLARRILDPWTVLEISHASQTKAFSLTIGKKPS